MKVREVIDVLAGLNPDLEIRFNGEYEPAGWEPSVHVELDHDTSSCGVEYYTLTDVWFRCISVLCDPDAVHIVGKPLRTEEERDAQGWVEAQDTAVWLVGAMMDRWEEAMAGRSVLDFDHPEYVKIIDLGKLSVLPMIDRLREKPGHWFTALHQITGMDPVPEADRGNLDRMAEAWIRWYDTKEA